MTLKVIGTADAERLFTVLRDSTFGWSTAEVPDLLRELGWRATTELAGRVVGAQTPWGLPRGLASIAHDRSDGSVLSVSAHASAKTDDQPVDRLTVADSFADLVDTATRVLGTPTSVTPAAHNPAPAGDATKPP